MKHKPQRFVLVAMIVIGGMLFGCDASVGRMQALSAEDALTPIAPVAELPQAPVSPVLVSEPVSVVQAPAVPKPEAVEVETSPIQADPPVIGTVEATDSTPAAQIIQAPPSITVEVAVTPEPISTPAPTPTPAPASVSESAVEPESAPAAAQPSNGPQVAPAQEVAQPVPAPVIAVVEAVPIPDQDYDTITADFDDEGTPGSNEESEIKLEGSCFKKKKVGVIWYHKKFPEKKKTISLNCKKGAYKARVKVKSKYLPWIMAQTVFFD